MEEYIDAVTRMSERYKPVKKWTCEACTYENTAESTSCQMCGNAKTEPTPDPSYTPKDARDTYPAPDPSYTPKDARDTYPSNYDPANDYASKEADDTYAPTYDAGNNYAPETGGAYASNYDAGNYDAPSKEGEDAYPSNYDAYNDPSYQKSDAEGAYPSQSQDSNSANKWSTQDEAPYYDTSATKKSYPLIEDGTFFGEGEGTPWSCPVCTYKNNPQVSSPPSHEPWPSPPKSDGHFGAGTCLRDMHDE